MKRGGWLLWAVLAVSSAVTSAGADEVSPPPPEADDATLAAIEASASDEALFPHLPILKPNIGFWTKVFGEYSEFQSVIHTADHPDRAFAVLDFRQEAAIMDLARVRALQSAAEKTEKAKFEKLLRKVHEKRNDFSKLNDEERRVYDLFAGTTGANRFKVFASEVRSQRGLKERTARALETSGKYLPQMEAVFAREGLPTRLTRLPLVESSFNEEAYSKVGAAGIWQFMPSSARIYMRLNEVVDDRADPWFSTEAAAQHLKDDYEVLGSWPLAVTAYNHGRGGLWRGLQKVGGNGLEDLIERYEHKNFGFASRNFYAEFLAASEVERNHQKHFGEVKRKPLVVFDQVQTSDYYIPYQTLLKLSGTDEDTFRRLNPAYRPDVIEGKLYVPPGHTLRLPQGQSHTFRTALASLSPTDRYEQQKRYYTQYKVKKGDTLARIAKSQGVTLAALKSANPKIGKKLKRGTIVRIPPHDATPTTLLASLKPVQKPTSKTDPLKVASSAPAKSTKTKASSRTHKVQSGQTLSHIAKRYRVTVASLRKANGMGGSSHLKLGQKLRIPTS
jgi:membrane-bound lytic murein transglycosylase D